MASIDTTKNATQSHSYDKSKKSSALLNPSLGDIAAEFQHHDFAFHDAIVYCPFDTQFSSFATYFVDNFEKLSLKKIIFISHEKDCSKCWMYDGSNIITEPIKGRKDYRNLEYLSLTKENNAIICACPPLSEAVDFIKYMIYTKSNFFAAVPLTIFQNRDIIGSFIGGLINIGVNIPTYFSTALDSEGNMKSPNLKKIDNMLWLTNFNVRRLPAHMGITISLYPDKHKRYDNYPAIHIEKMDDFIMKADAENEILSVPLSYVYYHNPYILQIVGCSALNCPEGLFLNGKRVKDRFFVKWI